MDPVYLYTFLVLVLCFLGLSWFAGSDAPYVSTKMDLINSVLKRAGAKKSRTFYELGSGDGRVVLEAAKLGAVSFGIEQSWLRVLLSKYLAKKLKLDNAHFLHGNIFKRSYTDADVIYIYLLKEAVARLEAQLKKELKKGSTVITQTYHFKNWKPFAKIGNFWIYRA